MGPSNSNSVVDGALAQPCVLDGEPNDASEHVLDEKARLKRRNIAEEMYGSEKTYLESIQSISSVYGAALATAPFKFVTAQKRGIILGNIEAILSVSSSLVAVLKERVEQWDTHSCIGDLWLSFSPKFPVYQTWIRGHRDAILALDSFDQRRDFVKWIKEVEEANPGVKSLSNLLIMPVQRLPRIAMLLASLLEKTPVWHRDHKALAKGLVLIQDMVSGVDGAIERQENLQKTYVVARRLGAADLMSEESRMYVRDGTLTKVCRKQDKERWFLLFSDILIYAAFDATKLSMKHERLRLDRTLIAEAEAPPFAFSIRSEQKSFIVYASAEVEKTVWMRALQERIDECGGGSGSAIAPLWTPDKAVSNCTICKTPFTLVYRKHHCRSCGDCICGKCSPYKVVVPGQGAVPIRVCSACFAKSQAGIQNKC